MGHAIGFGTLWAHNNLYTASSGEFRGEVARGFWQSEFGQTGTPDVELGGSGSDNWNEVDDGGGFTGITDSLESDMRNELMTEWLNGPTFISENDSRFVRRHRLRGSSDCRSGTRQELDGDTQRATGGQSYRGHLATGSA